MKNLSLNKILVSIYVLLVLGLSVSARAESSLFPIPNQGDILTEARVGRVIMSVEHEIFLVTKEGQTLELQSELDLSAFNGQFVQVIGFDLSHKVGPVYETKNIIFTDDVEDNKPALPIFVVVGLNEISI